MRKLTVSKIANTLGFEKSIIENILSREDEELLPYMTQKEDEDQNVNYILDLEGLPILIKKLSFNLPTSEIIENLTCQVLHLTALEQNNISLKEEVNYLSSEVKELHQKVAELQNKISDLQNKMEEEKTRGLKYKIGQIFKH